jgi:hypothetical protein
MGKQKSSHCDDEYILFAYSSYISVAARRVVALTRVWPIRLARVEVREEERPCTIAVQRRVQAASKRLGMQKSTHSDGKCRKTAQGAHSLSKRAFFAV